MTKNNVKPLGISPVQFVVLGKPWDYNAEPKYLNDSNVVLATSANR